MSLWKYTSFEDRAARRTQLAADPQWQAYLEEVRSMLKTMNNRLMTQVL